MELKLNQKIKTVFLWYKKKFIFSKSIYIAANLAIIFINITLTILNARAIQANIENPLKWIFFVIAVINILLTFVASLNTLFALSNRVNKSKDQIEQLEALKNEPQGEFANKKVVDTLTALEAEEY